MIEEERFGGMEEGDSSGMVSVIVRSCPWKPSGQGQDRSQGKKMRDFDPD